MPDAVLGAEGVVVIGCGKSKAATPRPAAELYTGPYFAAMMAFADALVPRERLFILSARYGVVPTTRVLAPYEQRMGKPGSVPLRVVRDQAKVFGLLGARPVVALGGRRYVTVCRSVWPHALVPLVGVGRLVAQITWLREHQGLPLEAWS